MHPKLPSQALWPDADGDDAQPLPYGITLRRLRDVFMIKNLFTLHDRILTIHGALAGVNAWTFEGLVKHSKRPFKRTSDTMILRHLMRRITTADALLGPCTTSSEVRPSQD